VVRAGRSMRFQDAGRLAAGDHVYIFVPDRYPRLLDRLFASRTAVDPEDADFFGAFDIDPDRLAGELEASYGVGLRPEEQKLTIAELIGKRLHGPAEYADRVAIGPVDLIVRDVDDHGVVTAVGLAIEPAGAAPPRIPVFLSAGEIGDRLRRLLARFRKRAAPPAPEGGEASSGSGNDTPPGT
jgi:cell volume regulation protein A